MRVDMAFGKKGLAIDLPEGFQYRVLEARSAVPLERAEEAIRRALDAPTASPPLRELAGGKPSAAISVCDITRPVPNRLILPGILSDLEAAGISRENITILIATGYTVPPLPQKSGKFVARILPPAIKLLITTPGHWPNTGAWVPPHPEHLFTSTNASFPPPFISLWALSNRT